MVCGFPRPRQVRLDLEFAASENTNPSAEASIGNEMVWVVWGLGVRVLGRLL